MKRKERPLWTFEPHFNSHQKLGSKINHAETIDQLLFVLGLTREEKDAFRAQFNKDSYLSTKNLMASDWQKILVLLLVWNIKVLQQYWPDVKQRYEWTPEQKQLLKDFLEF